MSLLTCIFYSSTITTSNNSLKKIIPTALARLRAATIPPDLRKEIITHSRQRERQLGIISKPAAPALQSKLKDFYTFLKTPLELQVPLYICNSFTSDHLLGNASAFAMAHAIFMNKNKLDTTFGIIQCRLGHEATHIHHQDPSIGYIFNKAVGFKSTPPDNAIRTLIYNIIGTNDICLRTLGGHHARHAESEADRKGHTATQCFLCIEEHAQRRDEIFLEDFEEIYKNNGYLNGDELRKIALLLQQKNSICDHHKKTLIKTSS